ncbi:MAG: T9SS type A sorting domain-containing protein [Bacteroidales bacterium]|nr:T9SS type A sorting domain-containing protein [Bacteroidales bacterium]MBN2761754.1 T9SS type A sorting domain-containing protein [Bacteroidales bacterium]
MNQNNSILLIISFLFISNPVILSQQPAFPGAEGFGKYASGGRGGRVIEVTSLLDKDRYGNVYPGTFREALNTAGDDPITIVFRVSGIIELVSELKSGRSCMTIAGQTAPGDGICIKDASVKLSGNNLIVRYLRFRPGDELKLQVSGLNIENAKNVIVDHCSFSWSIEENATFYDNKYTTVQWCILSESLYDSYHSKGPRGYAGQWGGQYASYHHNLIAHNQSRSPRINGSRAHDTVALVDFRNNVIFNWGNSGAIYGGEMEIDAPAALSHTNMINNYYKPGPGTDSDLRFCRPSYVTEGNTAYGYGQWYLSGNVMEGVSGGMNTNNWLGVKTDQVGDTSNIKSDNEFEVSPVTTWSAQEAFDSVMAYAGAIRPVRDTIDKRIISEAKGETGIIHGGALGATSGLIDSQNEVGGWPEYHTPLTGNIPADTDHDGMPDSWENSHGLNATDPEDGKIIAGDGYSNLEHYLNSDIPYIPYIPSGLAINRQHPLLVYPNPSGGLLNLTSEMICESYEFFDLSGKLMISGLLQNNTININNLNRGIYFLKLFCNNGEVFYNKITKL